MLWYPDTCKGGQCIIEIGHDWTNVIAIQQKCTHHAALALATEQGLFDRVIGTNRAKNNSTYAAALELAVEYGSVPWRIDDQDRIVITTGLTGVRKTRLQTAVDTAVGAGKVVLE